MFLYSLPGAERAAFPVLARAVIHVDQRLLDDEQAYLERLDRELAVPPATLSFTEALDVFRSVAARRAAFCELVAIAWVDGALADEEAVLLESVADAWSISGDVRVAIYQWVRDQAAHLDRAHNLFASS